jgi:hypothetical protein
MSCRNRFPDVETTAASVQFAHLIYRDFIALQGTDTRKNGGLQTLLGNGREF